MSTWRRTALEMLPEFSSEIARTKNPMALWIKIWFCFKEAFSKNQEDLVRRIFRYAEWCLQTAKQEPTEVSTAAWCAFYEHLSQIAGLEDKLHKYMPQIRYIKFRDAIKLKNK